MVPRNPLNSTKMEKSYVADERKTIGREAKLNLVVKDAELVWKQDTHSYRTEKPQRAAHLKKKQTIYLPLDAEIRDSILTLKNRVSTTLTLEDVIRSYRTIHPCTLLKVCGQVHYSKKGGSGCYAFSNCSTHVRRKWEISGS